MSIPSKDYVSFLEDPEPARSCRARLALSWEERLFELDVLLRWPPPSFDDDFDAQVEYEVNFQLKWSNALLALSAELTTDEQAQLSLPKRPYTEEGVTDYVAEHKNLISKRSFWNRPFFGQKKSADIESLQVRESLIDQFLWRKELDKLLVKAQTQLKYRQRQERIAEQMKSLCITVEKGGAFSQHTMVMKAPVTQDLYFEVLGEKPTRGDHTFVRNLGWIHAVIFANSLSELMELTPAYTFKDGTWDWGRESDGWRLPTDAEWRWLAQGGGKEHCDTSADIWEWCWEFSTELSDHYLRLTCKISVRGYRKKFRLSHIRRDDCGFRLFRTWSE